MNIALPALLLFLIILPGILFRYSYRKGFWECPIELSTVSNEITHSILYSLIFHFIFLSISELIGFHFNFQNFLRLLLNHLKISQPDLTNDIITQYWIYIFSSNLIALVSGYIFHYIVRSNYLDLKFKFFRFKNEWYYLFYGEADLIDYFSQLRLFDKIRIKSKNVKKILNSIAFVYVSVIVTYSNRDYLYRGILQKYYFDHKGKLDKIILRNTKRRDLSEDNIKDQSFNENTRFYDIKGDYLTIRYSEIKTLNIEYIYIEKK